MITYHFKNLAEIADFFESKAKRAEKTASTCGPQIKARHTFEAAAYYDAANILRAATLSPLTGGIA